MPGTEIKKLNEKILLSVHKDCQIDPARACLCYSLHLKVAQAISKVSIETLKTVSNNAQVLIHPGLIPLETWQNIEALKDDALSSISSVQNFPNP